MQIDARGKPCPQPVLLTKKSIDGGAAELTVIVDNEGSAENVRKFAAQAGYEATIARPGKDFELQLRRVAAGLPTAQIETACPAPDKVAGKILVITTDAIGRGSDELGHILMKAFINTLAENDKIPAKIILLNGGVKTACVEEQTVEALRKLESRGVEILACGTCLNYFQLTTELKAGHISNAFEILNALLEGDLVQWS